MKRLMPRAHGYADYFYGIGLLVGPLLFDFDPRAKLISYLFGVVLLMLSLLTNYPRAAIKSIPFPIHGGLELIMSGLLFAMPWVFGFSADTVAKNYFLGAGILMLSVWLVTEYQGSVEQNALRFDRKHFGNRHRSIRL